MANLIRSGSTFIYPGGDQPRLRGGHLPGYMKKSFKRIAPGGRAK